MAKGILLHGQKLFSTTFSVIGRLHKHVCKSKPLQTTEDLHIVSRCIDSLAMKVCFDPDSFTWPVAGRNCMHNQIGHASWSGISSETKPPSQGDDWWYYDRRSPIIRKVYTRKNKRDVSVGTAVTV